MGPALPLPHNCGMLHSWSFLQAVINLENHKTKEKLRCIADNIFQSGEVIDPSIDLVKQGFDSLDMNDLFLEIEVMFWCRNRRA